ncbi:MAG: hypothetical protein P1V34_12730 [Alphaproteobacteria bacterium]|nr:hypothetical protein [Alphaproteobacteria bacterium]
MAWNLFGGKKKAEKSAKLQAKSAMPPIMAPNESAVPSQRGKPSGRPGEPNKEQMDALTVLAAIETAKKELADREDRLQKSARAQAQARSNSNGIPEDPAAAVERKRHLIHAALSVHRFKQNALSDLSPTERDRLRQMAETSLGVSSKPKK